MSLLGDLDTLRRAGILKPLGPRTTIELGRQILREGFGPHLVYTLHGTQQPDRPALIYNGRVTTWGQLLDRVRRLANHLLAWGVGPGDAVTIMLGNRPEFIESEAAALRVGATIAFVNPRTPAAEARDIVTRTGARVLVTTREDVRPNARVLFVPSYYEGAIAAAPNHDPHVPRSGDAKVVIFTSGTTGRPKGAVRSLSSNTSPSAFTGFLRQIPMKTSDVHMIVCPLYHATGSGFATIAGVLGNTMVIVERFSPEEFCRTVQEHKVTTTAVVPTMLHRLVEWGGAKDYDLSSLRVVVCTGAPLREETRAAARDVLGDVLYDLYGSTEMGWVTIATPEDQKRKPGTVGRPVEGVRIRIVDSDGREVSTGTPGEVWASSALLMQGYLDDPELERERVRDGFVSVRDVGYLDTDGYLHLVDRADDMIISGGVNVYPSETEVALGSHPDVAENAVFGVPDPEWGEKIVAAVVPRRDVTPQELIDWTKEHADAAAVPKEIRFVDELPRNDVGKVDKKTLKAGWSEATPSEGSGSDDTR
jgi:fatty-acyl-CoA synthase